MRWLVFALVASLAVVRADFVAPAEGPVPFRRDKLPVDVDTIGALSRQVTVLTRARLPEDASGLRAAAQMTALALALDPANRQARDLIEEMKAGGRPVPADEKELQRSRSRAWQILAWLEMPEAGPHGQALAACLADVLVLADPDHPKAKAYREKGEQGAWKDWVAPESAFRKKEAPPEPEPEPMEEEEDAPPAVMLAESSTPAPLWSVDVESKKAVLNLVPVAAKVSSGSESGKIEIRWGLEKPGALAAASRDVAAAIARRHDKLQGGLVASFTWKGAGSYDAERNGTVLSGTAVILLDAAITGQTTSAVAFAVVGEEGKLELPPGFWSTLRHLSASAEGRRIILPAKAQELLPALLVLDDASFFMDNEVLLAGTADELCDLASATSKPLFAEALSAYDEIRKAGQGKALGPFLAHPSTQARLNKLAASMPQHASARLLAQQGSGSRPRFLQRAILAREIRNALQPILYLRESSTADLLTQRLDEIHEESRKKLDELFSVIEIRDRDLHKSAVAVADGVRTLARMLDKEDPDYPSELRLKQTAAHQAAWSEYLAVLRQLTEAAGDGAEFKIPKPLGQQ